MDIEKLSGFNIATKILKVTMRKTPMTRQVLKIIKVMNPICEVPGFLVFAAGIIGC